MGGYIQNFSLLDHLKVWIICNYDFTKFIGHPVNVQICKKRNKFFFVWQTDRLIDQEWVIELHSTRLKQIISLPGISSFEEIKNSRFLALFYKDNFSGWFDLFFDSIMVFVGMSEWMTQNGIHNMKSFCSREMVILGFLLSRSD